MSQRKLKAALDSMMLSYYIDAHADSFNPRTDPDEILAAEKVALMRCRIYIGCFWVFPTVRQECQKILNIDSRTLHDFITSVDAREPNRSELNLTAIEAKENFYTQFHPSQNDCRIVAEAEDYGVDVLVSFDTKCIKRLKHRTQLRIVTATEYWSFRDIPRGADPVSVPLSQLANEDWWQWK